MSSIERDHDPTSDHDLRRRGRRRHRRPADSAPLETQLWRIGQWRRLT